MKVLFSLCSISSLGIAALALTALFLDTPVSAQDGTGKK
ncbi:MAG: hypothetical protein ACI8Q9_001342, partial [Planctomycetota bacterium]